LHSSCAVVRLVQFVGEAAFFEESLVGSSVRWVNSLLFEPGLHSSCAVVRLVQFVGEAAFFEESLVGSSVRWVNCLLSGQCGLTCSCKSQGRRIGLCIEITESN
jgi:hypothetical protein